MDEIALTVGSHPGLEDGSLELGVVGPLVHRTTHAMRDYLRILTNPHERLAAPQLYLNLSGCTNIDIHGLPAPVEE